MPSKLNSIHWQITHPDAARDRARFEWMQPYAVKNICGDEPAQLDIIPKSSIIVVRHHEMSENWHNRGMHDRADALSQATTHAAKCNELANYIWQRYGIERERLMFPGLNEPEIWLNPQGREPRELVALYYRTFGNDLRQKFSLRGMIYNGPTGHPDNTGPGTAPVWDWAEPMAEICADGWHLFTTHEYWHKDSLEIGWNAGRFRWIPWNIPLFIGECGIAQVTAGGEYSSLPQEEWGWSRWVTPAQYRDQLIEYDKILRADPRIKGAMVFTYDFSRPWGKFNIARQDFWEDVWMKYYDSVRGEPDTLPDLPPVPPVALNIRYIADKLPRHATLRYATRPLTLIDGIAIHHSATAPTTTPEQIANYHINPDMSRTPPKEAWPGISYHFLVYADGTIYQTNDLTTVSYHIYGHNNHLAGICLVGNFTDAPPPEKQLAATKRLVAHLTDTLHLPRNAYGPHNKWLPSTECPGDTAEAWLPLLFTPKSETPIDDWPKWFETLNAAWNAMGQGPVALDPNSAFFKRADELHLGHPTGNTTDIGQYRIQGFRDGILVARIGVWHDLRLYKWNTA